MESWMVVLGWGCNVPVTVCGGICWSLQLHPICLLFISHLQVPLVLFLFFQGAQLALVIFFCSLRPQQSSSLSTAYFSHFSGSCWNDISSNKLDILMTQYNPYLQPGHWLSCHPFYLFFIWNEPLSFCPLPDPSEKAGSLRAEHLPLSSFLCAVALHLVDVQQRPFNEQMRE